MMNPDPDEIAAAVPDAFARLVDSPSAEVVNIVTALSLAAADAETGECRDCQCSTCVTIRGSLVRLPELMGGMFS